ncbi:MAG: VOC family protein [Spirochaetia bacterium]
MKTKFSHINLVSRDWRKLAEFYIKVFDCRPKPPERNLSGDWLDKLTELQEAHIQGIHLLLPGCDSGSGTEDDSGGPTLEIFQYNRNIDNPRKRINLEGFGHIAFAVENVEEKLRLLLAHGGSTVGELINTEIEGVGRISLVYAKDPEGNIIEIQKWE